MTWLTQVLSMSPPGQLVLFFVTLKVINAMFRGLTDRHRTKRLWQSVLGAILVIFLLNYLCYQNYCGLAWSIVVAQLLYLLVTILMVNSVFRKIVG